ncbi:4-alpha-glucanotransferase [Pseudomonas matsuisoli]|uniref:4-alpha-glucanotransferase n=1 Tax=Pseudomonas matsuisoli TaxID=1515666 RepID=A0A917PNY8_9PSED|nr:4-alpha-glucanotransferase [Pseudomonas matsuisoli]GGJ86251.1 4-alpha-glucanotransferase [Pseudomonas matsuisoli]
MSDERLEALAKAAGLAIDWVDADGKPQRVTPEVLRTVIDKLGYRAETTEQIHENLKRLEAENSDSHLPPLLTADHGQPVDLSRYFSADTPFNLTQEDGSRLAARLDLRGFLPAFSNSGYQQLDIGDQTLTIAVAPPKSPSVVALTGRSRAWGLGAQVYSLRRHGDGGLGDTQSLEQVVRTAAAAGADALAISPLHAMFSADTHRYSPYSPSSRLFNNVLHAAPASILGERAWQTALERTGLAGELKRLESLELIDWPAAAKAKLTLMRSLYDEFLENSSPLQQDYSTFRHAGGEALENHCRFEALHAWQVREYQRYDWRHWPEVLRDPRSAEVARFAQENAREIGFHAFCQWLISRGLERAQGTARSAGMGIGLIADLAVGADGGGSQAWSRQDELLPDLSVGAPPDILNRSGQSWGISAFSPTGLKRHGFRAFIEMLRANFAHAGGMRIDHVMGLYRLWVMPQGADPLEGAYLHYPLQDMLRLLTLEAERHRALVLGEDLGTVPDGFRDKLIERGILGMRIMLFEQDHDRSRFWPPTQWDPNALATTTTHDLPTVNGWWQGNDIEWRAHIGHTDEARRVHDQEHRANERRGLAEAFTAEGLLERDADVAVEQVVDAATSFIGRAPAPLALLPVEDALGLKEQANLPGDVDKHPNWRRRWPLESDVLLKGDAPQRRMRLLDEARRQSDPEESGSK